MAEQHTPRDFGWALVELMGHRQRVGMAREEEIAGGLMLRVDIPTEGEEYVTEFYGSSSIYALRPISEAVARDHFAARDPRPVNPADYRRPALENHPDEELEAHEEAQEEPWF